MLRSALLTPGATRVMRASSAFYIAFRITGITEGDKVIVKLNDTVRDNIRFCTAGPWFLLPGQCF
jgi:hypothetical protein